jgi:hypothetical protein
MNPVSAEALEKYAQMQEWTLRDDLATIQYHVGGPYKYLKDDSTYLGQYKNGMKHGIGNQISNLGEVYIGNFAYDQ